MTQKKLNKEEVSYLAEHFQHVEESFVDTSIQNLIFTLRHTESSLAETIALANKVEEVDRIVIGRRDDKIADLTRQLSESQKECERHREIELAAHNEIVKLHTECEKIEQMITFYLLDTDELTYINSEQVLTHVATKIKTLTAEVERLNKQIERNAER